MLDLSSGLPYFWIRSGLPFDYPTLERDHSCDVLVVGGGITGALCAHALAEDGAQVTVVDGRAIATGSTAASTALLQYEIDVPLHQLVERVGAAAAERAYQLGVEAVQGLIALSERFGADRCTPRKSLQFASKRTHEQALMKEQTARSAIGIHCELLDGDEVRRLVPGVHRKGLLTSVAAEVDPYRLTHDLLQEVRLNGGNVFERTSVRGVDRDAGALVATTSDGLRIRARHVLMCTGYESQQYLSEPVMELQSTYALASERMADSTPWADGLLIWETAQPYLYLRTTKEGRAIIGGLDEPFKDARRRDRLLARKSGQLTGRFERLFPGRGFKAEYAWCGTFGTTKDGLPYFDRDPATGLWFVLGMGGNGITFSWIGARIVRDAIRGRRNPDASLFRFGR